MNTKKVVTGRAWPSVALAEKDPRWMAKDAQIKATLRKDQKDMIERWERLAKESRGTKRQAPSTDVARKSQKTLKRKFATLREAP